MHEVGGSGDGDEGDRPIMTKIVKVQPIDKNGRRKSCMRENLCEERNAKRGWRKRGGGEPAATRTSESRAFTRAVVT